jgi:hypothetical protein
MESTWPLAIRALKEETAHDLFTGMRLGIGGPDCEESQMSVAESRWRHRGCRNMAGRETGVTSYGCSRYSARIKWRKRIA